jgi:hypothetical protein
MFLTVAGSRWSADVLITLGHYGFLAVVASPRASKSL